MPDWQSRSQVRWDRKDHVVILPKYHREVSSGRLRRQIGPILRDQCRQRGVELVEEPAMPDYIHPCVSIPPKSSVTYPLGPLKGEGAVRIHRESLHERRMMGLRSWAAGYGVSTVGLDGACVRRSIREQEELERRPGELHLEQPLRPRRGLPHTTTSGRGSLCVMFYPS